MFMNGLFEHNNNTGTKQKKQNKTNELNSNSGPIDIIIWSYDQISYWINMIQLSLEATNVRCLYSILSRVYWVQSLLSQSLLSLEFTESTNCSRTG